VWLSTSPQKKNSTAPTNTHEVAEEIVKFLMRHCKDEINVSKFNYLMNRPQLKNWIDPHYSVLSLQMIVLLDEEKNRLTIGRNKFGVWDHWAHSDLEREFVDNLLAWWTKVLSKEHPAMPTFEVQAVAVRVIREWVNVAGGNLIHLEWRKNGFQPLEAIEWTNEGLTCSDALNACRNRVNLFSADAWAKEGIPIEEINEWIGAGFVRPKATGPWFRAGHSPESATELLALGLLPTVTPTELELSHARMLGKIFGTRGNQAPTQ
jgi:hypothetical protein